MFVVFEELEVLAFFFREGEVERRGGEEGDFVAVEFDFFAESFDGTFAVPVLVEGTVLFRVVEGGHFFILLIY